MQNAAVAVWVWESIYRWNVSDKLCGDMLSPFFLSRFGSAALLLRVKKVWLVSPFWILLKLHHPVRDANSRAHVHSWTGMVSPSTCLGSGEWKKFSSLFFCWETGPLWPHSSSFRAHSLLTLPSHKSSFTIYNPLHCSAPAQLNSLNLT